MNRICTVQARAVEKIIKFAITYGVSADSLCTAVGLDPRIINDPEGRIPFAQLVFSYEVAAKLTGDDMFGLRLGASVDPKVFDVLGYVAMNSLTVGAALTRIADYHSIWTDGAAIDLSNDNGVTRVVFKYIDATLSECRQDTEMAMAAVLSLTRLMAQSKVSPVEVRFKHASPSDTSEHSRIFRAPLRFNAGVDELVFDRSVLALPVIKADPELCKLLDRHAEELLAKHPRPDMLIDRVRSVIRSFNGGDPSLKHVAQQLGLSERTLQRRLRGRRISYRQLLDEGKREAALRYLKQPEMPLCEIAHLLGFSENSALHRAFRRWTGMTPGEFRQRHFHGLQASFPMPTSQA